MKESQEVDGLVGRGRGVVEREREGNARYTCLYKVISNRHFRQQHMADRSRADWNVTGRLVGFRPGNKSKCDKPVANA